MVSHSSPIDITNLRKSPRLDDGNFDETGCYTVALASSFSAFEYIYNLLCNCLSFVRQWWRCDFDFRINIALISMVFDVMANGEVSHVTETRRKITTKRTIARHEN